MDRVFNQEIKITLRPDEMSKVSFMNKAYEIEEKVKEIIYEKFNTKISIHTQMKFGIDYFAKKMNKGENFTFVKYGDGELLCMLGAKGENCDFHPYSDRLGELLKKSFGSLLAFDNVYLADWKDNLIDVRDMFIKSNNLKPKFADYDCFLTVNENLKDKRLFQFYKSINESKRKKVFIGPKQLSDIKEMLKLDQFIEVPVVNAFSKYDEIKNTLLENIEDNSIYIFCCSMMSCVLCNDIINQNSNVTLLDIGSGFDPIFVNKTRPKQPSMEDTHRYYAPILPKNIIRNNEEIALNILSQNNGII